MSDLCINLICPPSLEEQLLDMLLIEPGVMSFTSAAIAAHGSWSERLNANEQVLGRALAIQIQVLCTKEDMASLLNRLREKFAGTRLRYWCSPILAHGEFV